MQNKDLQRNFKIDLKIGDKSERLAYQLLSNGRHSVTHTPIQYWFDKYGVDKTKDLPEECDFIVNDQWGVEVKSLAGGYPTLSVELWADDDMKYRPGWIKSTKSGLVKRIMFHKRDENAFYVFDSKSLYEYIKFNGRLTRAKNGCSDDSGWLKLVEWENQNAGFICKVEV